ncbi:MAG: tetratricopeptide repeat protein [Candidatus Lokiarchaeota archaeon]|nr:tetratricopeptide repeat protein [Candidatus Lokiarchaeota archaeon]
MRYIKGIEDSSEQKKSVQKIISDVISFSKEIQLSGDLFDSGEFLYWAAEIVENIDHSLAIKLYKQNIKVWEKQIEEFHLQAKLHEIAEIYLKIAEIYRKKFKDFNLEKEAILKSVEYLIQESKLQIDFNEIRKLAHSYENIAELYMKLFDYKKAINYYSMVIEIAKQNDYFDLLSFSYQQIGSCFEALDDYDNSKKILIEGIEYFTTLFKQFEKNNDQLALSQISQILKSMHEIANNEKQYVFYLKKEAGAYINLAESLEKNDANFQKIAQYYRGAALCYKDLEDNWIESASCFALAGNYSEKNDDFDSAATNYFNAGELFRILGNLDRAYKYYVRAGSNYWDLGDANLATECFLAAYDIDLEGGLDVDRIDVFNRIVSGLNKIAEDGLKDEQFFMAAALILEGVKFYEKLDDADDMVLRDMVRNVFKYYYRAANLKQVGFSHIVHSYVIASLSSILIGNSKRAKRIMSEIESQGYTVGKYKKIVEMIISWLAEGKEIVLENFPYRYKRLMSVSEDILYLLKLFKNEKLYRRTPKSR